MKRKTLGSKIEIATDILDANFIIDLNRLKEFRNNLAHGVVGEIREIDNPIQKTGNFSISSNMRESPLTAESLAEVISLSRDINEKLTDELKKSRTISPTKGAGQI